MKGTSHRILNYAIILLLSVSCSPDKRGLEAPDQPCRIAEITLDRQVIEQEGDTTDAGMAGFDRYEYDEEGRIVRHRFASFPKGRPLPPQETRYEYADGKLQVFTAANPDTPAQSYTLNAQGLWTAPERKYDAKGFILEEKNETGALLRYTYANGNAVRVESQGVHPETGPYTALNEFEYDLSRPNLPDLTPHLGRKSVNLPVRCLFTNTNPAGRTRILYEYRYRFLPDGQVAQRTTIQKLLGPDGSTPISTVTTVKSYSITCR
ncbi:hypothetical protein [Larkinella soli]|uniref:hypothetical protein n=1 Tax=Larkinella soli TaxID=1770527 RepID=UPI000FFB0E9D|nr:hypothetical protein [Larkinella soli]